MGLYRWLERGALGVACVLCVAVHAWAQAPQTTAPVTTRLTFLHFNDSYQIVPERSWGGFAELQTLLKRERARSPHSFVTFGGDLISPSLLSSLTKGAHMIELMNGLGVTVASLGNHEFDHGIEVLRLRIGESKFPWMAANVTDPQGVPLPELKPYVIRQAGPLKIGFFGLITPQAGLFIKGSIPVKFASHIETAKTAVAELQKQSVDVIVAVTHLGIDEDTQLARTVRGIKLVLGGHEHIPMQIMDNGVLVMKAGADNEYLGVVDLDVTKSIKDGKPAVDVVTQWRLVANYRTPADPAMAATVKKFQSRLDIELGGVVGRTTTILDSRGDAVRSRETTMGNLVADAIRATIGADVALVNGGGLRGNKLYPAGFQITRKDILGEMPFNNVIMMVEVSGAELKQILEHGVADVSQPQGRFPQVSGVKFVYDAAKPAGERIETISVGDQPLDAAKMYTLAVNDFLAAGGDGYTMLKDKKRLVDSNIGPHMAGSVIDYLVRQGTVSPKIEGRVVAK